MFIKRLGIVLLFISTNLFAATTPEFSKLSNATMILYKQNMAGGMDMNCTATVYEGIGNNYKLLTAAHCVVENDQDNKSVITKKPIFVSSDEDSDKGFIKAVIEKVGKADNGYDIAVLSIVTERKLTVIPLGDEKKEQDGSSVIMVSVPAGLGKTCFHGYLAKALIDRPLQDAYSHVNWQGTLLVQISASPGSSGSSIMSCSQEAIVGLLVGVYENCVIAVPVSRLSNLDKDNWIVIKK